MLPRMTVFEVIAEPTRRRILSLLRERERAAGELVDRLGVGVDEGANLNAPSSLSTPPPGAARGAEAVK